MKIGENIAMLRRKKGVTQAQLADELHFTRQAISNWERGQTEPDAQTLPVLAAYFGVSTDELLGACPASHPLPPSASLPASPKRRLEVQTTVPAAKALRAVLWAYAGLTAAEILLQFAKSAAAMLLCSLCGIFAAAANLAVFILFLIAKQPSDRRGARAAFYACWIAGETCSLVYLFAEGIAALVFGIAALLLTPVIQVFLVLSFQSKDLAARRRYFILLGIYIALALAATLTAFLSPDFSLYLTSLADPTNVASLLLLERALFDRTVISYYSTAQACLFSDGQADAPQKEITAEQLAEAQTMREQIAASNAAQTQKMREQGIAASAQLSPSASKARTATPALREITEDVPAFSRTVLPAAFFIGAGLFLLFFLLAPPGSSVAIFVTIVLLFSGFPAFFGILFFLVKAGTKKTLHALAGALWTALMLLSAGLFISQFLRGGSPHPAASIAQHGGCFALYTALLFALPPDKKHTCAAYRSGQILLLAAAAALTAFCLWLALRGWIPGQDESIAALLSNAGFSLLLLLLHFLKADRTLRKTIRYGVPFPPEN